MRALVVSDSHGYRPELRRIVEKALARGVRLDAVFHCGDGLGDLAAVEGMLREANDGVRLAGVRGNCDFSGDAPWEQTVEFGGARIFITHGHHFAVKSSLALLDEAAHEAECSITLFGHTHEPCMEMRRSLMLNPGSAADGRFLLLDVQNGRPKVEMGQSWK